MDHSRDFQNVQENNVMNKNKDIIKGLGIQESDGFWVFGYGSLLWRVNFQFDDKVRCYIKGYVRRLWQSSTDHRGTPEYPGRVFTVLPSENKEEILWGFAYHVPPEYFQNTLNTLIWREKGGYVVKKLNAYKDASPQSDFKVLLWIAEEENHNYGGDIDLVKIAERISKAVGPSGTNIEYLMNATAAMRENAMFSKDDEDHIGVVEKKVKEILSKQ